jgi:hypothetical protein
MLVKGDFLDFSFYLRFSTLFHLPPLNTFTVSEDAGIKPRTVATTALAFRRFNHSAISHLMDESKKCDTLASSVFRKITKFRIEIIRCWEDLSILAELDLGLNPNPKQDQDSDLE